MDRKEYRVGMRVDEAAGRWVDLLGDVRPRSTSGWVPCRDIAWIESNLEEKKNVLTRAWCRPFFLYVRTHPTQRCRPPTDARAGVYIIAGRQALDPPLAIPFPTNAHVAVTVLSSSSPDGYRERPAVGVSDTYRTGGYFLLAALAGWATGTPVLLLVAYCRVHSHFIPSRLTTTDSLYYQHQINHDRDRRALCIHLHPCAQ